MKNKIEFRLVVSFTDGSRLARKATNCHNVKSLAGWLWLSPAVKSVLVQRVKDNKIFLYKVRENGQELSEKTIVVSSDLSKIFE